MAYKYTVDYVWIGGNSELRSKIRVIYSDKHLLALNDIPIWNYDGSSTDQAQGDSSEVFIRPKRLFKDPFKIRDVKNHYIDGAYIVMCSTFLPDETPAKNNHRHNAEHIFQKYADQEPWYGLEQEYFIYNRETKYPWFYDPNLVQGQFYCSVGGNNCFLREMVDKHMKYCLYAGIKISGINAEVAPSQWEFQIGPVEGIDAADQLWIARYILEKISEQYNSYIVYDPKPLDGDWNGSGCHTNFSTKAMRNSGGYQIILDTMNKLEKNHNEHMAVYGTKNNLRMTGKHETSSYDKFSYGIASRKCSVRIPNETKQNNCGYFEDRRPAANIDPYQVTSIILKTTMSD
jgi:glutamine synthetase